MAFPNTSVLDNFNRTAESPLSKGGLWVTSSGPFGIAAGKTNGTQALSSVATGTYCGSGWNSKFALPAEAYVTLAALPTGGNSFTLYWIDTPTGGAPNGYAIGMAANAWNLQKYTAGGSSTLTSGSVTWGAGDAVGISISAAGVITAWRLPNGGAWTALGTSTDATYTAASYFCWSTNDAATLLDNFGGGVTAVGIPDLIMAPPHR